MALRSGIRRTWENGFFSTREEAGGRTVSSAGKNHGNNNNNNRSVCEKTRKLRPELKYALNPRGLNSEPRTGPDEKIIPEITFSCPKFCTFGKIKIGTKLRNFHEKIASMSQENFQNPFAN